MADVLGTSSGNTSQLDSLVNAYRSGEKPKLDVISTKKKKLETTSKFYQGINTRLNALVSQLDNFGNSNISDKFKAKGITSSDTSIVSASATKEALEGLNSVKVNRLATSDLLVSSRQTLSDSFGFNGEQSFKIAVGSTTKEITVNFDGTETNEDALKKIVNAVNNTEDFELTASYVKDTSSTGRLTFSAKGLGTENKITFEDSAIMAKFGFVNADLNPSEDNRKVQSATSAGYKIANSSQLDAEAEVNGIVVSRSSNTLEDVINGVTLTLKKAQASTDSAVNLETGTDVATVKSTIQPLIDNFNILLNYLNTDKEIKRGEPTVAGLASRLREIVSEKVTTVESGNPEYITSLGLKIDSKGNLSINDEEKLKKLLKENPQQVLDVFTSADGFVKKVEYAISGLQGDNGTIKNKTLSLARQIDATQNRYEALEKRIDKQGEVLRKQYTDVLKTYYEAQGQYQNYNAYLNSSSY